MIVTLNCLEFCIQWSKNIEQPFVSFFIFSPLFISACNINPVTSIISITFITLIAFKIFPVFVFPFFTFIVPVLSRDSPVQL